MRGAGRTRDSESATAGSAGSLKPQELGGAMVSSQSEIPRDAGISFEATDGLYPS